MIYDCFLFFNELDLLEIRLSILDKYVDYFVIVESTETFSGLPKPLYYDLNEARFAKWKHKIIHHVICDYPINTDITDLYDKSSLPKGLEHWKREFYQKECIKIPLLGLMDNDICFVSDLDEIWNPESCPKILLNKIYKFRQTVYSYYLNNRSDEEWAGTFAASYNFLKNGSINRLDTLNPNEYIYVENGGWHFTNMGDVRQKIESYGHQEFNTDEVKNKLKERLEKNEDYLGRKFKFKTDASNLPKLLVDNYKFLFKQG